MNPVVQAVPGVSSWFGFELGYDKFENASQGVFWGVSQYNGNIKGQAWRTAGDGVQRQNHYQYDNANRLLTAFFEQRNTNGSWNNTEMDFTFWTDHSGQASPTAAYDLNGNLRQMGHRGFKPGALTLAERNIDVLLYDYHPLTNRLKKVSDNVSTPQGLGDFTDLHTGDTDYNYDTNGNLIRDLNKRIGTTSANGITYNHLNLPLVVTVRKPDGTVKGTITYTYDAAGTKLRKIVSETGANINGTITNVTCTTHYAGGLVYESKTYTTVPPGYNSYTYQLQFFGHEEGRVRAVRPAPHSNPTSLVYDYMLKDHLGNVRAVLTEQIDTTIYPALSFEGAPGSAEVNNQNLVWENANGQPINVTGVRIASPGVLQNSGLQPPPFTNSLLVRSNTGKVGAGKLIKVMAGDRVHTSVQYYYPSVGTQPQGNGLSTLLGGLASVITNSAGAGSLLKTASGTLAQDVGLDPAVVSFFTNQNSTPVAGKPRAYLNVLFFDEQFKMDANASMFRQVGTGTMNPNNPGQIGFMAGSAALAKKSGYCYIYISNETDDLVYFDNFTLSHERSSLMEETHYYPFGLTMAGISSKAAGKLENRKGYNGNELQNEEFSDGSGLDVYDFNARTYDQQIGRFIQIDPLTDEGGQESLSPFHFSYNNPVLYSDPDGKFPVFLLPFIVEGAKVIVGGAVAYYGATKLAPVVTDAIMNTEAPSIPASSNRSVTNNSFAWDPGYLNQMRIERTTENKPKGSANDKVKNDIKVGQEAHRQEQAEIKKQDPAADIEKTIQLKDGTVVRKDAILSDGTPVIVKPNTPSGKRSADKREKLLINNGEKKPEVRLYNPKDPKYQPGSPTYIGPKKQAGGSGW